MAWHEGWYLLGKEHAYDVLTQRSVARPLFSFSGVESFGKLMTVLVPEVDEP